MTIIELERTIDELLNSLEHNQKKEFGIFCIKRVLNLYKKVDETEDLTIIDSSIKKGSAFKRLNYIFSLIVKKVDLSSSKIKELLSLCEPLILDIEEVFDNTTENVVSMLVAQGVDYLLRYLLHNDNKYVLYCSSNNIEILNQLKSNEYYQKNDDEDGLYSYLDSIFEEELRIQIEGLNYIKKDSLNLLENLIYKSQIVHI